MEIVIKISEDVYTRLFDKGIQDNEIATDDICEMARALRLGKPLPKGHGRLIDADAYRKELRIEIPNLDYDGSLEPYEEGIYSAIMLLDDVPTIIEAEKEDKE